MAYSIQTAVSDGTLAVLDLSIKYMDKSHIQVYVDDVLADGSAYSYVWLTDTRIQLVPAVANGSTLKILRKTLTDEMWHEFTQGARFSTASMDENFEQLLFLAQEYSEGIYVSDFYTDIDMHLKRITNLADPVSDGDAVNLKTLKDFLPYGEAATGLATRITVEEAKSAQLVAQGITLANLTISNFVSTGIANGSWIHFAGRDTAGDGGGGSFWFSSSSTQPANGGTVFAPTGGGRLFRDGWTVFGFNGVVSVAMFGAKGGSTDDTAAFNAAIASVALSGTGAGYMNGRVAASFETHTLLGTVLIPDGIELDLKNSTITGSGIGSSTDLFRSAFIYNGAIYATQTNPNSGTFGASVKNATIKNCGKAFNLYKWIDNCEVSNIKFYDCTYAVYAEKCFYSRFVNLFSRGSAANATNAAFYFKEAVNVQALESVFVTDRKLGIHIVDAANGQTFYNCSAEQCETGILVSGETGPLKFDTCYIEGILNYGVDLNTVGTKHAITFDNCWFMQVGIGIKAPEDAVAASYINVLPNCRFVDVTTKVDFSNAISGFNTLSLPPQSSADNGVPLLPAGYYVNRRSTVNNDMIVYDSGTGAALIKSKVSDVSLLSFEHAGDAGTVKAGTVPFCTTVFQFGGVYVRTKIVLDEFTSCLVYKIKVNNGTTTYTKYGLIVGDTVIEKDAVVGHAVSVASLGGYLNIIINETATSGTVTGIVRHL